MAYTLKKYTVTGGASAGLKNVPMPNSHPANTSAKPKVLSARIDGSDLVVWAEVDTTQPDYNTPVYLIATDSAVAPSGSRFVCRADDGAGSEFHVYVKASVERS